MATTLAISPKSRIWPPGPFWIGIVATVLATVAAVLALGLPLYRQFVAVCEIENAGGTICAAKRPPGWLRQRLGDERMKYFDEVERVYLVGKDFDDSGLERISSLPALQHLDVRGTRITDAGLKHVKKLTNLRTLLLDDTQISGSGLEHLGTLPQLEVLSLERTRVNDFQLVNLEWMTSLRELWLCESNVTESGASDAKRTLPFVEVHFAAGDSREASKDRILREYFAKHYSIR
jgi:hypothetical protein